MRKRTVLVTGASRGIGRAVTDKLLERGHTVVGLSRSPARTEPHDRYHPVVLDVAALDTIAPTLRDVLMAHPRADALVSNAGGPAFGHLEQYSPSQVRAALDLNLTSHILVVRAVLPHLRSRGGGDVVVMGSEAARRGGPQGTLYCAAKFGLRGFTQALRHDVRSSGVRVTLVNPGAVRTDFFAEQSFRPADGNQNAILPGDVADAVALALEMRAGTMVGEINLEPQQKQLEFDRNRP